MIGEGIGYGRGREERVGEGKGREGLLEDARIG